MKRMAIVGAGGMARTRARALLASGQVEICAVASRHLSTAQAFASEIGCATYFDDYRQLMAVHPDALLVEVPHTVQDEITGWALEQNLHLLIGGVLAANTENAQRILDLARSRRRVVEAGFEARYDAVWIAAKTLLDSGELGELVAIRSLALSAANSSPRIIPSRCRRLRFSLLSTEATRVEIRRRTPLMTFGLPKPLWLPAGRAAQSRWFRRNRKER